MALTRKFLSALGIEDDKVDEIINAHTETVNALKEQRDEYKKDAEKLPLVQKELDDIKAVTSGEDTFKVKYEALKEDYNKFKAEQEQKETHAKKESAYKALLQEVGISEKRINAVLKVSNVDALEFDNEGKVKDADKLKQEIGEEWSEFVVTTQTTGTKTPNPPSSNTNIKMTKADIYKKDEHGRYILSTAERQKALMENASN